LLELSIKLIPQKVGASSYSAKEGLQVGAVAGVALINFIAPACMIVGLTSEVLNCTDRSWF
jgi:hypothetical protein